MHPNAAAQAHATPGPVPRRTASDRLGIGVSALCAAHCLLMPAALSLLPLWPRLDALHVWIHPGLAALVLPAAVLAMWNARCGSRPATTVSLLIGGLLLVLTAMLPLIDEPGPETACTLVGSGLLITGHLLNRLTHPPHIH